jgi:hypothetical protein
MAWNAEKTELLKQLLHERKVIESRPELAIKYGINKSVIQVIGSHCSEAVRQAILNELITDKLNMIAIDRAERQAYEQSLTDSETNLNSNKE